LKERYCNIQSTLTMPGKSTTRGNSGNDAERDKGSQEKSWFRE